VRRGPRAIRARLGDPDADIADIIKLYGDLARLTAEEKFAVSPRCASSSAEWSRSRHRPERHCLPPPRRRRAFGAGQRDFIRSWEHA